jgi:hypothetical protein
MRAFFARLPLATQAGCAPSALRGVMPLLEEAVLETAQPWAQAGLAQGEGRESLGGVDETCLERLRGIFQALPTGYLVLGDIADERPLPRGTPWWKHGLKQHPQSMRRNVLPMKLIDRSLVMRHEHLACALV